MALAAAAAVRRLIGKTASETTPMTPVQAPTPPPRRPSSWPRIAIGAAGALAVAILAAVGIWLWGRALAGSVQTPAPATAQIAVAAPSATPAATPVSSPAVTPDNPDHVEGVVLAPLDIRSGPGPDYPVLATVPQGNPVLVTGISADGGWFQIAHPGGPGGYGWVRAEFVQLPAGGNAIPGVALASPPPTVTSTPTATPTPTPTATSTPVCATPVHHRLAPDRYPGLGCAVEAWEADFTFQRFERGLMVWRKAPSPSQIYVLYEGGAWRGLVDPKGPPRPSCPEGEATGGLGPVLSFGLIWCAEEMERLGAPLSGEIVAEDSPVEQFQHGLAFRLDQLGYVLYEDDRWDSFVPAEAAVQAPAEPAADRSENVLLEDFESYTPAGLERVFTLNDAWERNTLSIGLTTLSGAAARGRVLAVTYDILGTPPDNYAGVERTLADADNWSSSRVIRFWVRNDAALTDLIFQWGEAPERGGEVWRARHQLQPGETRLVEIPLTRQYFSRPDWSPVGNGVPDLDRVTYYAFFVERAQPGSGVLYLDAVELLAAESAPIPPSRAPCAISASGEFANLWQKYRDRLGCPWYESPRVVPIAGEQLFQNGHMFYLSDRPPELIVVYNVAGEWEIVNAEWYEGQPEYSCQVSVPPGLWQPRRGFGEIWCNKLGGPQSRIGWALDDEKGFSGQDLVQDFDGGLIFVDTDGLNRRLAYIFFTDNWTFSRERY